MIGKTLGHYEITEMLGKGGMGEVYRAHDSKLGRDVAIKVLPTELSNDPERTARFDREARALASLQDPHVASIYGFEELDGIRFLIMELVEGSELSLSIEAGAMPLDDIRRIARQIASGLEAAHDRGIVHRDLKPANIMITPDGGAKILDFGLARAWYGDPEQDGGTKESPTITAAMTQAGTILGTAAYMSPEQARGRNVDRRADIWAFGVILWEMITGKRLFEGETISDTLTAVLRAEPDWSLLPKSEAPLLCLLIERCLVRDPQLRLRDIGEARILMQQGSDGSVLTGRISTVAESATTKGHRGLWIGAILLALLAGGVGGIRMRGESGAVLDRTTFSLTEEQKLFMTGRNGWSSLRFSPDGKTLAYVGGLGGRHGGDIYLRRLDSFESTKLPDSEGARLPTFSPDGKWIAYFSKSRLWKKALSGGAPIMICETPMGPGLEWGNGELYFVPAMGGGLWAVSENGGTPRALTTINKERGETSHRWPSLLPDGKHLLLTIKTDQIEFFHDASIALLSLEDGTMRVLLEGGTNPRYHPDGFLVYGRGSELFTVDFDPNSGNLTGTPRPSLAKVQVSPVHGSSYCAVGPRGELAFVPLVEDFFQFDIVWKDREGRILTKPSPLRMHYSPDLSPDGSKLVSSLAAANDKLWITDLELGTTSRLTTTAGNDQNPVWSPDGRQIVFSNDRSGPWNLFLVAADGSTPAALLLENESDKHASSWSPDGRWILFRQMAEAGSFDLMLLDLENDGALTPWLQTPQDERHGVFSPDGSHVAYISDISGGPEVYIRPFPGPGTPQRISRTGAFYTRWRADGEELLFGSERALYSVQINPATGRATAPPQELFSLGEEHSMAFNFDIAPDGQQILAGRMNLGASQNQIRILFDWARP